MPPTDKKETGLYLQLDCTEPAYAGLADYAGRIGALLSSPTAQSNPDLAGSLDDLLGAVYALIQAKQHGFSDRSGRINIRAVEKRALSIARGKVRTDGKWIAGFYFNNALFRTAAVFHRSLKIVTGRRAYVPELLSMAQALCPSWVCVKLSMVHNEVNELKHSPRGVHDQRTVSYADTVGAVGELLHFIEAYTATRPTAQP